MEALRKVEAGPGLELAEIPSRRGHRRGARRGGGGERLRHRPAHQGVGRLGAAAHYPPLTLGHEFAGTVVEAGDDVRDVEVGDYVSAESHVTCGMCFHCRTGQAHMCERTQILGVDRDGAFARYVAVPESVIWKNDRAKLPPEIATLQEPFGNAVFATERAGSLRPLGRGARLRPRRAVQRSPSPAPRERRVVLASDRIAFRLDLARTMGATRRVDVDDVPTSRAGSSSRTRASASTSSSRCPGSPQRDRRCLPDRSQRRPRRPLRDPRRPVEIDVAESLSSRTSRSGGERPADLRDLVQDALAARERRRRPAAADHAPSTRSRTSSEHSQELEAGEACKIIVYPGGGPRPLSGAGAQPAECASRAVAAPVNSASSRRARRRARRAPRGRYLQALQHAALAAGAGRRDGGSRRGARALVEQLPRPGRAAGGGRGGDRGRSAATAPEPRRSASSAARSSPTSSSSASWPSSSAPRPRSPTSRAGTQTRP